MLTNELTDALIPDAAEGANPESRHIQIPFRTGFRVRSQTRAPRN